MAKAFVPEAFDPHEIALAKMTPGEAAAQARAVALENGYNDGLAQAAAVVESTMEEANAKVRRALSALTVAIDEFDSRQTIALADVEDAVIAMALEIAAAVLQKEIATASTPGADALARALKLLPDRGEVVARLNPEDVATLNMDQVSTSTRTVVVVPDPNVEPGGCVVDAGETRIDAQLSSALANVRAALGLAQ